MINLFDGLLLSLLCHWIEDFERISIVISISIVSLNSFHLAKYPAKNQLERGFFLAKRRIVY